MIEVEFLKVEDVPEALRSAAEERDGKHYLKIEAGSGVGVIPAADHATLKNQFKEFRNNNIGLEKSNAELTAKLSGFDGVDAAEFKRLHDEEVVRKAKAAEDATKGKPGNTGDDTARIAKAVQAQVGPMQERMATMDAAMKLAKTEKDAAEARVVRKDLEATLSRAGLRAGVDEKALTDYLHRGLGVWQIVEGKPVAMNGETPLFNDKGEALSVDEWATALVGDAPHLFKPSSGGGTGSGGGSGGPTPKKVISAMDTLEFGKNLKEIAAGTVVVRQPSQS